MARNSERATVVRVVAFMIFLYYIYVLLKTSIFTRLFSNNVMRGFQLIPFKSAAFSLDAFRNASSIFISSGFKTFTGPVFMFLPLGFLLPFIDNRTKKYINILGLASLISVAIEILQFITKTGITSVDDFILNLIGAILGFLIYHALRFAFVNS